MIGRALRELRSDPQSTLSNPADWLRNVLTAGARTRAGVSVTPESALRHADVFACIRVLAEDAGSLPLHVYQGEGDDRQRVNGHPTAKLLQRPAPYLTLGTLVSTLVAHLNAWGNGLWLKERGPGGRVIGLHPIHPSRLVKIELRNGEPVYTIRADAAGKGYAGELTRLDVIHFKALSLDGLGGLSPISQAREAIGLGIAAEEYAAGWWAGNATPSGILEFPSVIDDEQQALIKRQWREMHSGAENAGSLAILEAGATYKTVGLPLGDSQFIEQRKFSTATICRIFRVFPWMVGAEGGGSMTYSNVETQQLAYVTHSLRPWLVTIERTLGADEDLFPLGSGLYSEFLLDALLRGDSASRSAYYTAALGKWMLRSEVRRAENLPAVPDDDPGFSPVAGPSALALHLAPGAPTPPPADPATDPKASA